MKLLHSHIIDGIAGSEGYLLNILPELVRRNVEIEFLCLYKKGNKENTEKFCNKLIAHGIAIHYVAIDSYPTYSALQSINKILKKGNYDLVHTHLLHADFFVAATKWFFGNKTKQVSTKHGYEEAYTNAHGFDPSFKSKNKYWRLAKFAEKRITRSFAISGGLYNLFIGLGISPKNDLDLIYYGFDFTDEFEYNEAYRFGSPQLAMVGRLTGFKGHRYAIQAVQKLKSKYPQISLVIVGSGELDKELKEMVKELGVEENVTFTGFQSNPRDYVHTSDLALLPSVSEGFGLVVLEAMSVKRALVTFNVPSPNELLENHKTGWMVDPYDVDQYAQAIEHLVENKEKREAIANAAYAKLKDYYNLTRMVDETMDFYTTSLTK